MTTATAEELRQLDERAQAFLPEAEDRRPSTFLSLAPAMSSSFPQPPKAHAIRVGQGDAGPELAKRRSSSLSSDGAKSPTGLRILKLGPVHYGEHADDHKGDWHDLAVE